GPVRREKAPRPKPGGSFRSAGGLVGGGGLGKPKRHYLPDQPSLRTGVTFARTNTPAKNTTSDSTRFAASVPSTPSMLATANTTAVARAGSLATRSQARAIICCLSFLLASYSPTTC